MVMMMMMMIMMMIIIIITSYVNKQEVIWMVIIPNKEREDCHSPPFKAEIKNEWSFNSSLPFCPLGVYTDNITSIFTLFYTTPIFPFLPPSNPTITPQPIPATHPHYSYYYYYYYHHTTTETIPAPATV